MSSDFPSLSDALTRALPKGASIPPGMMVSRPFQKLSPAHQQALTKFITIERKLGEIADHEQIFGLDNAEKVVKAVARACAQHCQVSHEDLEKVFMRTARATELNPGVMRKLTQAKSIEELARVIPSYIRQSMPEAIISAAVERKPIERARPKRPRNGMRFGRHNIGNAHNFA